MPRSHPPSRASTAWSLSALALLILFAAHPVAAQITPLYTLHGDLPNAELGIAVAGAGDVNGDGFDDVVVGITDGSGTSEVAGRVRVFSGVDGELLWEVEGDSAGDAFGTAVDGAGDVDGDGFADVVVGARYAGHAGIFTGTVTVYSGPDGEVLWTWHGDEEGDRLGYAVAGAGDVDDDGFDDVVAGALFDGNNGFWSGSAWVFSGKTGAVLHRWDGDETFDQLGAAVAGVGDLDGDGHADVAAGSTESDLGGPNAGLVRVWSGADGGLLHEFLGSESSDGFGFAIAGLGDLDGDEVPEIAIGERSNDAVGSNAGAVWVFSGAGGGLVGSFFGDSEGDQLGFSVADAGDVDLDGVRDLWIGAPFDDATGPTTGSARLVSGRDSRRLATVYGAGDGDFFGVSVAGLGDADGDGMADLVVGASHADAAGVNAGSAVVFVAAPMFVDGFESGDAGAWSAVVE